MGISPSNLMMAEVAATEGASAQLTTRGPALQGLAAALVCMAAAAGSLALVAAVVRRRSNFASFLGLWISQTDAETSGLEDLSASTQLVEFESAGSCIHLLEAPQE